VKTIKVYSTINDENITKDLVNSPIWKECYHPDDTIPPEAIYVYHIKFDGLKPIQVTKTEILK